MQKEEENVEPKEPCHCKLCTDGNDMIPNQTWCNSRDRLHEDLADENPKIARHLAQCEALEWCHKWLADLEGGDLCMDFEDYPPFMTFISIMNDMLRGRAEGLAMSIGLAIHGEPRWLYGFQEEEE